jgi:hypothetical protein
VLPGLLTAGAVSMIFAQQQPQQTPPALEIQKVKDNLYMITGGGGNTPLRLLPRRASSS